MTEYTSFNSYCRREFGCKVYKLALSCSNSCPNRDGKVGIGGCIFCAEGSGSFAAPYEMPIAEQIEYAKKLVSKKAKNVKYIAYFQAFTSTYGDESHIRNCLLSAAKDEQTVAVSVGTRPDCLPESMLEILSEVSKIKPVFVELGFQTAQIKTAELINRCCKTETYTLAAKRLHEMGIKVVFHVILGLPGETESDMLESVKKAVEMGADGIKLQLLHILRGTRLADMYKRGEFRCLELSEYVDILEKCLRLLPKEVVVHRLTGDGDKKLLLAPTWSADKKAVLNLIASRCRPYPD